MGWRPLWKESTRVAQRAPPGCALTPGCAAPGRGRRKCRPLPPRRWLLSRPRCRWVAGVGALRWWRGRIATPSAPRNASRYSSTPWTHLSAGSLGESLEAVQWRKRAGRRVRGCGWCLMGPYCSHERPCRSLRRRDLHQLIRAWLARKPVARVMCVGICYCGDKEEGETTKTAIVRSGSILMFIWVIFDALPHGWVVFLGGRDSIARGIKLCRTATCFA